MMTDIDFEKIEQFSEEEKVRMQMSDEVAINLIASLSNYGVHEYNTKRNFENVKQEIQKVLNDRADKVGSVGMYVNIMDINLDSRIGKSTLWEWAKRMDKIKKKDKLIEFMATFKSEFYKTFVERIFASDFCEKEKAYTIIPIPNFEKAKAFASHCDWCICQAKFDYDTYTLNGETFYFCLKEGFETTAKRAGDNYPYDEYGVSMLAISVTPDGQLATCTNRWNVDRIGNPNLTIQEISQMLGRDFYEVFKPIPSTADDADYCRDVVHRVSTG